jgi:hypothetical protein
VDKIANPASVIAAANPIFFFITQSPSRPDLGESLPEESA